MSTHLLEVFYINIGEFYRGLVIECSEELMNGKLTYTDKEKLFSNMTTVYQATDKTTFTTLDTSESIDNHDNESIDYSYNYYSYDDYMYPGYSFERPVYLFIWEILVITTFLLNIVVLLVFIRRKMFSPTIAILSAIAISDSLTGLVTLPTYIMVFQRYEPALPYDDNIYAHTEHVYNNEQHTSVPLIKQESQYNTGYAMDTTQNYEAVTLAPVEGYAISKDLCRSFMISKYFLSTSFHTISMFLTVFLGIQRYLTMAYPFKAQTYFSLKKTKQYCIAIFVLTPALHLYHTFVEKAKNGMCQWYIEETGCKVECIYLWAAFIVRHFIPCCTLGIFTVLFILQLHKGGDLFEKIASSKTQVLTRIKENRRVSVIVTVIFIVRLIPEIPYSIFLLYNGIDKSINNGENISLETNRVFHMSYELLLILSFQCNFYIYVIFNRKFRSCLLRRCIKYREGVTDDRLKQCRRSVAHNSQTAVTTLTDRGSVDTEVAILLKELHVTTDDSEIMDVAETLSV